MSNNLNENQLSTNSNKKQYILRYKPHEEQKKVHQSNARFKIICAGRRGGKSLLCAGDIINRALSGKYNHLDSIGWVSPTLQVSQRGVEAFKLITQECPDIITWYKSAPVSATFINGVKVVFLSADNEDGLRGWGWNHLVIDEANFLPDYLWDSVIRPSLADKKGTLMAISSPRAKNTFFHKLYLDGLNPELDYIESFHFPSSANPLMTKEEIEQARMSTPESVFRQEYLAEFPDGGGEVFAGIDKCIDEGQCNCNTNTEIGIDLARHVDFTVLTSICSKCNRIKNITRFNDLDWTIQKARIKSVYINTETPTITMDTTGLGDVVYDDLRAEGLKIIPFKFNNTNKQQLINNLRLQIMEGNIKWNKDLENAAILKHELECYEVQQTKTGLITYNGRSNCHDDCVISLALAVNRLKSFIHPIINVEDDEAPKDFMRDFEEVDNSYDWGESNATFFGG